MADAWGYVSVSESDAGLGRALLAAPALALLDSPKNLKLPMSAPVSEHLERWAQAAEVSARTSAPALGARSVRSSVPLLALLLEYVSDLELAPMSGHELSQVAMASAQSTGLLRELESAPPWGHTLHPLPRALELTSGPQKGWLLVKLPATASVPRLVLASDHAWRPLAMASASWLEPEWAST